MGCERLSTAWHRRQTEPSWLKSWPTTDAILLARREKCARGCARAGRELGARPAFVRPFLAAAAARRERGPPRVRAQGPGAERRVLADADERAEPGPRRRVRRRGRRQAMAPAVRLRRGVRPPPRPADGRQGAARAGHPRVAERLGLGARPRPSRSARGARARGAISSRAVAIAGVAGRSSAARWAGWRTGASASASGRS